MTHSIVRLMGLCAAAACAAIGQTQPHLMNAQVQTRTVSNLSSELPALIRNSNAPQWIGYSVPKVEGFGQSCCGSDAGGKSEACSLDGWSNRSRTSGTTVRLEPSQSVAIFYRAQAGRLTKLRVFSCECDVDAGGLPVVWLNGVKADESIAYLQSRISTGDGNGDDLKLDQPVFAIAAHAGTAATRAMEQLTVPSQPFKVREKAVFWLAAVRGREGFTVLQKLARTADDPQLREKLAFAFQVTKDPGGAAELLRMAKEDSSPAVRGQAIFWIAQKAGAKAASSITDAIANDPNTDVKKKAVFALSQLPSDEGVPKLIEVARTNRNPEVRKQAFFWLGQSKDPRAFQFLEQAILR